MKKLAVLAALAISAVTFNPVEASAVSVDNPEITEMSHWTQFRDSITGHNRHKNDNRDHYESRHDYGGRDRYAYNDRGRYDDRYDDRRDNRPPPHRRNDFDPPPRHRW